MINEAPPVEAKPLGCGGKAKASCCSRFLMLQNVYELELWEGEIKAVDRSCGAVPLAERPLATRYICWRRSVLTVAILPYCASVALRVRDMLGSLNKQDFFDSLAPETDLIDFSEYQQYFEGYYSVHAAVQVIYALSLLLSLCLMVAARARWSSFASSKRWLRLAYMLSFSMPYLLLLVAPYKQGIDGEGAELQLCQDMLSRANESFTSGRFSCPLDREMCSQPADRWSPMLRSTLDECGVLRDPQTGSCPFAEQWATAQLQSSSTLPATTPPPAIQTLCTEDTGCAPCIDTAPTSCGNVALAVSGPQAIRESCARCFTPVASWSSLTAAQRSALGGAGVAQNSTELCAQLCAPLLASTLPAQYAGLLSGQDSFCINDQTFEAIATATELALHFDHLKQAVGAYQAIMTLATLFPASFSLMFGSIKGATLCKMMLPWSRLPGYMIGASIVFCLPMFMALLAVIYQALGDFYCKSKAVVSRAALSLSL